MPTELPQPAEPGQAPPQDDEISRESVIQLPGGAPEGAVVDERSGVLAVALRAPDRLALVDLDTRNVRAMPTPGAARHLVKGGENEILLLAEDTGMLLRVALPSGQIVQQTKVGRQPHDAAQVGDTVFVTNEFSGTVGVVRGGRMVRELGGLAQPGGLAAAGNRVVAIDVRGNRMHVFDANTLDEVANLPAGQGPSHVRPIGQDKVAVADTRGNAVLTFDLSGTPRQIGTYPLQGRAYGLATDTERDRMYATLADTNRVVGFRVNPNGSLTPIGDQLTVEQPNDVAVDHRTGGVYVAGAAGAELQVIQPEEFEE